MDPIFEAYLEAQRRRRASPLTLKTVAYTLRTTQRWLDQHNIAAGELSLLDCEQYFDSLLDRGAVATARRHLTYLRAAYRYAIRHGLATYAPTVEVKLPRLPDHQPETYTNDELRAIHAAISDEREEAAFYLFAFAGLRLGETAALSWPQVDLERWQLRLTGKAGKFRLVPLHPVLLDVLREQAPRARHREEAVILSPQRRPLASPTLGRHIRALAEPGTLAVVQQDNS